MPVRTSNSWTGAWRARHAVILALGAAFGLTASLGVFFFPLGIPESSVPARVFGRAHLISVGQNIDVTALQDRLGRLGYRPVQAKEPRSGEYRRERDRIVLHRRGFVTPEQNVPEAELDIRLDQGHRIVQIRDQQGERMQTASLEPEPLAALDADEYVDRLWVALDDLPRRLVSTVLTVEDRRFFDHEGLDIRRIFGALLANLRAGKIHEGGSTLTQQLAKNVFLTHERTLTRKLHEAWLALRLESGNSKREILEAYLNTIYLGQRGPYSVEGVDAAAHHYFGKSARELSLTDCALLVGMIKGPGFYSPFTQPARALKRRNLVLQILKDTGQITDQEYRAAINAPLGTLSKPVPPVRAPYFLAKLRRDLAHDLPDLQPEHRSVLVYTDLDVQLQLYAERAIERGVKRLETNVPALTRGQERVQAALIALDPATGAILAHVGGRDWSSSQFDHATQARRQPGSVFKPIVALAALSRGDGGQPAFTLASLLQDEPLSVNTPAGLWQPTNHGGAFHGTMTFREAIEQSVNVPIARVGLAIGPEAIVRTAQRMGIEAPLNPVASLALGTSEVPPLEIATAYALLATGGERVHARSYSSVVDRDGKVLAAEPVEKTREFAPAEVALVTSALRGVVDNGTGRPIRSMGYAGPLAGKTGTTNDSRDAWFVGYTPELVAAVWVGFDDGKSLGLTGARAALPIFGDFIIAALGRDGGRDFTQPYGLEIVPINAPTGLRAGPFCWGEPEVFLAGTAPQDQCGSGWFDFTIPPRIEESPPAEGDEGGEAVAPDEVYRDDHTPAERFLERLRGILGSRRPSNR